MVALSDFWSRQPCAQSPPAQNLCGGLGDWVDPLWPVRTTDAQATSSFYNSLSVAHMSEIATALGRHEEAERYAAQFDSMTAAFYLTCKSCAVWASCCGATLGNHTSQTASIMALALHMAAPPLTKTGGPIPANLIGAVASNLVKAIGAAGNHTTSGIIGATFVFDVLIHFGFGDVALAMLLKDDQPSFGYMISQGATTLCVCNQSFSHRPLCCSQPCWPFSHSRPLTRKCHPQVGELAGDAAAGRGRL